MLKNAQLVASCNGITVLLRAILDPSLTDIANSFVLTLLYILDHPSTRKYLRPSLDVRQLLAPFCIPAIKTPHKLNEEKRQEIALRVRKDEIAKKVCSSPLPKRATTHRLRNKKNPHRRHL